MSAFLSAVTSNYFHEGIKEFFNSYVVDVTQFEFDTSILFISRKAISSFFEKVVDDSIDLRGISVYFKSILSKYLKYTFIFCDAYIIN